MAQITPEMSDMKRRLEDAMKKVAKGDATALPEVQRLAAAMARKIPGATEEIQKRRAHIATARERLLKIMQPGIDAMQAQLEKISPELVDEFLKKATSGEDKNLTCLCEVFSAGGFGMNVMLKRINDAG